MFNVNKSDLAYEKCLKIFREDGEEQQVDPNAQQPQGSQDPSVLQQAPVGEIDAQQAQAGVDPNTLYKQALMEMDKKIQETGRKRYQKYKMNGGNKSYKDFVKEMEKQALEDINDEMKEMFGYIPGKETEKDLLNQIKELLTGMKTSIDTIASNSNDAGMAQDQMAMEQQGGDPNAQQPMDQEGQPQEQPMEDPNAQGQEQQGGDPNAQQPMQESLNYLNERLYRKKMNECFNYYFNERGEF